MTDVNAYQPCPCHADQKIKFCCGKQMVDDLNQVMTLARGQQHTATMDKLDRLIAQHGPKDCLLTLKTHFLINLLEIDKAHECNEQFLQSHPHHPIGLQHRAMICLAKGEPEAAIDALQDAMDQIKGKAVPVSLGSAFRMVGLELLRRGQPIAARQHLGFARTLNREDEEAAILILESYRIPVRSLLLKQDLQLPAAPEGRPWTQPYQQLQRLAARGQWRLAFQLLESKLLAAFPDEPVVHHARAVLALWLGRDETALEAWKALAATPNCPEDQAVEAELWVLLMSPSDSKQEFDITQSTIPIVNVEQLMEQMNGSDRFVPIRTEAFADADSPPPKAAFAFLDRPALTSSSEPDRDRIPNVVSEVLVYGKRTDQNAHLDMDLVQDENADALRAELHTILADSLDWDQESRETIGTVTEKQIRLSSRWHLPQSIDPSRIADWEKLNDEYLLLTVWPQIRVPSLDNQSPAEVKGKPEYRVKLQALVGELELADRMFDVDFDLISRLRQSLDLAAPVPPDPNQFAQGTPTTLQRQYVRWDLASDEVLLSSYLYAVSSSQWRMLRGTCREILDRPRLEEKVPFENVCAMLSKITRDNDESLGYLRQARKLAVAKGQPQGIWLVAELEWRLRRNIAEKTEELLEEIQARHMHEPEVQPRLHRLLAALGIIQSPAGAEAPEPETVPTSAGDESSPIWTPQSAQPTSGGSKLWIPGSE